MQKERYIAYEVVNNETSEREELQGFASYEAAIEWSRKYARKHNIDVSIDWQLEEINRMGREILDTDADMAWVSSNGERVR